MKKFTIILIAILALLSCGNPFVNKILPNNTPPAGGNLPDTPDTPDITISTIVDFEADAIGKTYGVAEDSARPTVTVVADPINQGQKSLKISSTNYNQAAVIPINLEQELYKYQTFSFRLNVLGGSDVGYKQVLVYAASTPETFVQYGFGNPVDSQYPQFAANFLGETPDQTDFDALKNTWTTFTIDIGNPGAAIRNLTGTIYIAIGIKSTGIEYLLDDLTFTGTTSSNPPVDPTGPQDDIVDFESAITVEFTKGGSDSPTVRVVADPGNGTEKSLRITTTGSGYNQAAVVPITLSKELYKFQTVSFRFRVEGGTDLGYKRFKVYAASDTATFKDGAFGNDAGGGNPEFAANLVGQTEEVNITTATHKNTWTTLTITISNPGAAIGNLKGPIYIAIGFNSQSADYYIDDIKFLGTSSNQPPGGGGGGGGATFPTFIDFEADAIDKTYDYTRGDNDPTVKVVVDPGASGQKSLQITTGGNGWNQAAIIPINLPKALSNYQSFTLRFRLISGVTDTTPRSIQVYAAANTSAFVRYGFGNPAGDQHQFAAYLVGSAPETLYDSSYQNKWTEYEIPCTPGSTISGLSGDIYIAVGMNCNDNRVYLLDDLTFSETSNSATITNVSPTTFDKKTANQSDVTVTIDLKGKSLSSIKNGATTLTRDTHYTDSGSTVIIKKEYLATLAEGTASLTFVFNEGVNRNIAINIINTSNSSISPETATFDLKTGNQADITVNMTLNGNTLSSIKNVADTLTSGTDYTVSGGSTVTISKDYLKNLSKGTVTLTFEFSAGASRNIVITIMDSGDQLLKYDFANGSTIASSYPKFSASSTGTMTAAFSGTEPDRVLRVVKTNTNHSTPYFILPFNLGTENLSSYSSIKIKIRGVGTPVDGDNTDYSNKGIRVYLNGSRIDNSGNATLNETFIVKTVTLTSTSATGSIELGFGLEQSKGYTLEIQSIELFK